MALFRDREASLGVPLRQRTTGGALRWLGQLGGKRLWGAYLPLVAYVGSDKIIPLRRDQGALPIAPPTARVLLELVTACMSLRRFVCPNHASMHKKGSPAWWRRLHRTHHGAAHSTAWEGPRAPRDGPAFVRRRRAPSRVQRARAAGAVDHLGRLWLCARTEAPAVARAPTTGRDVPARGGPLGLRPALDDASGLAARVRGRQGPRTRTNAGRPPLPPPSPVQPWARAPAATLLGRNGSLADSVLPYYSPPCRRRCKQQQVSAALGWRA